MAERICHGAGGILRQAPQLVEAICGQAAKAENVWAAFALVIADADPKALGKNKFLF